MVLYQLECSRYSERVMEIVAQGPSRGDLLAAFGSDSHVKFGTGREAMPMTVQLLAAVGAKGDFGITIPRASLRTPQSACIIAGISSGGREVVAYVTFDDPVEGKKETEHIEPGTFMSAALVKRDGVLKDLDLNFADTVMNLFRSAVVAQFCAPTP